MKRKLTLVLLFSVCATAVLAQGPPDYSEQCREALKKLSSLSGVWEGKATVTRGPGTQIIVDQREDIEFTLDGTLLSINGKGKDPNGSVVFSAMGIVNYDAPRNQYKLKSYTKEGNSTDAYFTIQEENKYEWGFDIPNGGKIKYIITIDPSKKSWYETGEYSGDGTNWFRFIELNLTKIQ